MRISVKYNTMVVKNLEESEAFYRDVLGFERSYHVDLPKGQISIMQSPEGGCIELIENDDFPLGLYSVGTDVDNLSEVLSHLDECGVMHSPVVQTSVGHMCFIKDPNGVNVCLIEHDIVKL